MKILAENRFGHGAIKKKKDLRDQQYTKIARTSQPFNWELGYDVEEDVGYDGKVKNQGTSDSCGGQAASYYAAIIRILYGQTTQECSAKYIYSQLFYPQGGTTLRDLLNFLVKYGAAEEKFVSSYENGHPPSEAFMRDKSKNYLGYASASLCKPTGYAFVSTDIDSCAQAIRDNHGAILQVTGQNNSTWLGLFPIPPGNKVGNWSHFVLGKKAKLINGKKYIGIRNSWGEDCGDQGLQWIGEEYFTSGNVTDIGVVYAMENVVIARQKDLYTKALELCQEIINIIIGPTKKII